MFRSKLVTLAHFSQRRIVQNTVRFKSTVYTETRTWRTSRNDKVSDSGFETLLRLLKAQDFDSSRVDMVRKCVKSGDVFSTSQVERIMKTMDFDSSRTEVFGLCKNKRYAQVEHKREVEDTEFKEVPDAVTNAVTNEISNMIKPLVITALKRVLYELVISLFGNDSKQTKKLGEFLQENEKKRLGK